MDLNTIAITGRATKDVELKSTNSGKNVTTISVAVNGFNEEVNYFDIICWDKLADIAAKYIQKGKQIAISGRLQQRKWQDSEGVTRYAVEIVAVNLKLLGSKEESSQTKTKDVVVDDFDDTAISLDTIPF